MRLNRLKTALVTESDYLELSTKRLIEFTDGRIEVQPTPTLAHQFIVLYLSRWLSAFVEAGGWVG